MRTLLIVEDGREYYDFFRLFLEKEASYIHAQTGEAAFEVLGSRDVDLVVLDMRFERSTPEDLLGDVEKAAIDYFGGDLPLAQRYVLDNQGTFILSEMRARGLRQPVLFVTDMPPRRLANLRTLYGRVHAVPYFDTAAIRGEVDAALGEGA